MNNGQQAPNTQKKPSILDRPMESAEIKPVTPGSYPGRLVMISEPFDVSVSKDFIKPGRKSFLSGREDRQVKMNLIFAVKLKDGAIGRAPMMVSAPDGKIWNTSNLWGVLETLAQGDAGLWNKESGLVRGVTLRSFLGKPCIVEVENRTSKKNARQVFTEAKNIAAPMDGLIYPTDEEGLTILAPVHDELEESENVPF